MASCEAASGVCSCGGAWALPPTALGGPAQAWMGGVLSCLLFLGAVPTGPEAMGYLYPGRGTGAQHHGLCGVEIEPK